MGSQENDEKQMEDCFVSKIIGTWVFTVAGSLIATPMVIKWKSIGPIYFFGATGTMLDIITAINACKIEHEERQKKLLEAQNSAVNASLTETGAEY